MKSRGVLYMTLSALGFSVMSVLVKLAAPRLPTGEIVLARALMTLVLSYVMVKRAVGSDGKPLSPWGVQRGKLVFRGLLGFSALGCYYIALARLPLADATTLHYIQPLITGVLAWWILDEKIGWAAAFAIACGVAGVVAVAHPGIGTVDDPVGSLVAVASATLSSIAYVTVRQLSRTEHPLVIVFYFPLVATPLAIPWAAANFVMPDARAWLLLIGIGIATQIGQVFLTMGLTIERAGRATSVGYIQICFALLWQLLLFEQTPALGTLAGAALIIGGTVVVSATAKRDAPPPHTPTSRSR
ncbi:MAG TPA: DMT family transporter [Kofleriaceae bacterium]|nr:DMT family transporter [Kofleriaceae bacterium]